MDIWCPWINTYAMQYIMILYTDFFPPPLQFNTIDHSLSHIETWYGLLTCILAAKVNSPVVL